ncbi:MAG: 3-oxoacyl-ACP reductase [Gammaproteobacteria bacterium]|nr:3-oxoacyl-ACP reductase [Gammaproteobacteria bacterium]RPG24693.1 MAG: SDR family oxidoreductase [Gammaproteobacteria bacterium TMED50]|tara:strand:- start:15669 stop:16469 length:801 start_codon:yes stop_codon:yes gene_type:complete
MSEKSADFYQYLFDVRDKVALVTGGTRGIGLMIAEGLVKAGARVYVASRKPEACEETQAALSPHGFCIAIPSDVATIDGCRALADDIKSREKKLDILVNNAGVTWSENIDDFHEKAWDKVMDLDVKSPFFLTQQLLPLIRTASSQESRASIINVTSVNGIRPSSLRNYSYVAAKAGLGQLSQQLARDLMDDNINVNVIAPGLFKSKMTASLFANEDAETQVMASQPMKRSGAMEDVAGLVIYLSSKAGGFITGVTIPCDGGVTSIN